MKARRSDGSPLPLHSWDFQSLKGATVSSAFKRVGDSVRRHCPEIDEAKAELILHFPTNVHPPFGRIKCAWFVHMISDEEMRHRGKPAIEIIQRHFQIKKAGGTQDHPWLIRHIDGRVVGEARQANKWMEKCDARKLLQ